jgi:hypothetical protein
MAKAIATLALILAATLTGDVAGYRRELESATTITTTVEG